MNDPRCDYLFVYGSLRSDAPSSALPAEARDAAALLGRNAVYAGRAQVVGALCAVDWYPGLIDGAGAVIGEVWRLPPGPALLGALDAYEGEAYARVCMLATMNDGQQLKAWAYRSVAIPASVALIASGDYLQWLRLAPR